MDAISVDLDETEMTAARKAVAVLSAVEAFLPRLKGAQWITQSPTFGADDKRTAPFQMTHWVDATLANSFEHLYAFQRTLGLPTELLLQRGPGYTLARGALESAVAVWWVLEPDARVTRVDRRLRIWKYSWEEEAKALKSLGMTPDKDRQDHWDEYRKQFEEDIGCPLKRMPAFADMLQAFDRATGMRSEACWRMCSAFAHGTEWAGVLLHQLTDLRPIGGEVNEAVSMARWDVIGPCIDAAGAILITALDRVDSLGRIYGNPTSDHSRSFASYLKQASKIVAEGESTGRLVVPVLKER